MPGPGYIASGFPGSGGQPSPALNAAMVARVFHALGDPTRRAIVETLGAGPASVSLLAEPLDMTITAVRQHLQVLEDCGLVRTQKVGRVRTCRIATSGFAVLEQWIGLQRAAWERRLDRLGEVLAETAAPPAGLDDDDDGTEY